jgi:hypothetical protein
MPVMRARAVILLVTAAVAIIDAGPHPCASHSGHRAEPTATGGCHGGAAAAVSVSGAKSPAGCGMPGAAILCAQACAGSAILRPVGVSTLAPPESAFESPSAVAQSSLLVSRIEHVPLRG